jgi:hypothetical protein
MEGTPLLRAWQLREQNARLLQRAADVRQAAQSARLAARVTRVFSRVEQQTPEQWDEHAQRWATLVEDAAQQLILTEQLDLLGGNAVLRTAEQEAGDYPSG